VEEVQRAGAARRPDSSTADDLLPVLWNSIEWLPAEAQITAAATATAARWMAVEALFPAI